MQSLLKARRNCTQQGIEAMEQRVLFSVPPTADAGGPYVTDEGSIVNFAATAEDSDGAVASYEWDLDYDGVTFDADLTGQSASYTSVDDAAERVIALRVTDDTGDSTIATSTLLVNDVVPTAALELPAAGISGYFVEGKVNLTGRYLEDGYMVRLDMGDGTIKKFSVAAGDVHWNDFKHEYAAPGNYTISAKITDADGQFVTVSSAMQVLSAGTFATTGFVSGENFEVTYTIDGVLRVGGTSGADTIRISRVSPGRFKVLVNGVSKGLFRNPGGILINGLGGNDQIIVDAAVQRSAIINGGDGNDTIQGGPAPDVINGWNGNDVIFGNDGADILMGALGADRVVGGEGSDALMGELAGWVVPSELTAKWLMTWIDESITFKQRITRLRNEFIDFSNDVLIRDDKARDSLDGGDGADWLAYPLALPGNLISLIGDVLTAV